MAAEGQYETSDMEKCVKEKYRVEFLQAEKIAPIDVHWHLLNIYEDQTVDKSAVRWWVVYFSSGDSDSGSPPWKTRHVPDNYADNYKHSMRALVQLWKNV